jgi:hypothetical protein
MLDQSNLSVQRCRLIFLVECSVGGYLALAKTIYIYVPFTIILNTQEAAIFFLLDWRQVLLYDVSFLNIRIVVNSVINLVNKNLPRTALQICMFHFNYNFTIIVPNAFNYLKNVTTWEQCSVEL